jgi:hypothetical protein
MVSYQGLILLFAVSRSRVSSIEFLLRCGDHLSQWTMMAGVGGFYVGPYGHTDNGSRKELEGT